MSAADTRERFAADLRELKLRSGDPTLHALSSQIHVSKGVLSEAFSGRRLPSEKTTLKVVEALGSDPKEWLERRSRLVPRERREADARSPEHPDLAVSERPTRRRWRFVLAIVLASAVTAGCTSFVWWRVLQEREAFWSAQTTRPLGDQLLAPADGVDPMRTACRQDKVIADVQTRQNDQFKVEMLYSNSCMGVWGRVTRLDGKTTGGSLSFRVYPADDPKSTRSQQRSADDVNSLYTPLLIEPDVDARVCGIATVTDGDQSIELGPPMCI